MVLDAQLPHVGEGAVRYSRAVRVRQRWAELGQQTNHAVNGILLFLGEAVPPGFELVGEEDFEPHGCQYTMEGI